MKIIIVTQDEIFYIPYFFKYFFKYLDKKKLDIEIIGLIIQRSLGQKSKYNLLIKMFNFYGVKDFFYILIKYGRLKFHCLLYKLKIFQSCHSIKFYAQKNDVKILKFNNINSKKFQTFVRQNHVNLIISVSASQIFKSKILNLPQYGCINIHNGPIPKYRGMMTNFWQMYNHEKFSTITIHKMNEKIDSGKVIYQERYRILPGISLDELLILSRIKDASALGNVLINYINNNIKYLDIEDKENFYYHFPNRKDVSQFKKKGLKLI